MPDRTKLKREQIEYSKGKQFFTFVLPILMVTLLMALILATAIRQFNRTRMSITEEMQNHLAMQSQALGQSINQLYLAIEVAATLLTSDKDITPEEIQTIMHSLKKTCSFDTVIYINSDGNGLCDDGTADLFLSNRDYYINSMNDLRAFEYVEDAIIDPDVSYFVFSVPIEEHGTVEGVLCGCYSIEHFSTIFQQYGYTNYPGANTIGIFTLNGVPIYIDSQVANASEELTSYPQRSDLFQELVTQGNDFGTFQLPNNPDIYFYQAFHGTEVASGYLISVLPYNFIKEQSKYAKDITIFLLLISLCVALALIHNIIKNQKLLLHQKKEYDTLTDALKVAESAREAKSFFLSRVSHEMRTPLNAIIGFLELAKDANEEDLHKYIEDSNIAAKQLLSVINDVLDMSSIDSGKLRIAHGPFDFKQLIQSITNIYLPICQQKGINYDTIIATPVDEWLMGDPLRLNQILMNLLGNAVKFTKEGQITLKIGQSTSNDKDIYLHFEVSDSGCGMSEDMQGRLFRPFEQDNAQTAQRYGGSGLGLSIVKNLVTLMNGAITVSSTPGKGSTFTVDLPFTRSDIISDPPVPKDFTFSRILIIDDSESERKYLSSVLSRMDIRFTCVDSCDNGLEALTTALKEHDPYNVCLVDWKMPEINGIETTKRIRKLYGDSMIVIVVSAYDMNQANERAKDAGASLFVAKPLFQSTILNLLMTLTGGQLSAQRVSSNVLHFEGRHILLAEDNAMNRLVAQGLLKKMNLTLDTAEDGQQAVDKFLASVPGTYSAILMDVQMPIMNGFEATKAIRASLHPEAKSIPIIALTANAFHEDIAKTLACGMNDHVTKPIEPQLLNEALKRAFDLKGDFTHE